MSQSQTVPFKELDDILGAIENSETYFQYLQKHDLPWDHYAAQLLLIGIFCHNEGLALMEEKVIPLVEKGILSYGSEIEVSKVGNYLNQLLQVQDGFAKQLEQQYDLKDKNEIESALLRVRRKDTADLDTRSMLQTFFTYADDRVVWNERFSTYF